MTSEREIVKTREQVSAGGVVYREANGLIEVVLILTASERRWQLPKGIIDPGETEIEAARREVREETGIIAEPIEKVGSTEYWFTIKQDGVTGRYHKKVHWYLMKFLSGSVDDHDHEVAEARWFEIVEACKTLAFKNEREMVGSAVGMIEKLN